MTKLAYFEYTFISRLKIKRKIGRNVEIDSSLDININGIFCVQNNKDKT